MQDVLAMLLIEVCQYMYALNPQYCPPSPNRIFKRHSNFLPSFPGWNKLHLWVNPILQFIGVQAITHRLNVLFNNLAKEEKEFLLFPLNFEWVEGMTRYVNSTSIWVNIRHTIVIEVAIGRSTYSVVVDAIVLVDRIGT